MHQAFFVCVKFLCEDIAEASARTSPVPFSTPIAFTLIT